MTGRDHTSSSPMYFFVFKRFEKERETKDGKMNATQIAVVPPSPLQNKNLVENWGKEGSLRKRKKYCTRRRMGTRGGRIMYLEKRRRRRQYLA